MCEINDMQVLHIYKIKDVPWRLLTLNGGNKTYDSMDDIIIVIR